MTTETIAPTPEQVRQAAEAKVDETLRVLQLNVPGNIYLLLQALFINGAQWVIEIIEKAEVL